MSAARVGFADVARHWNVSSRSPPSSAAAAAAARLRCAQKLKSYSAAEARLIPPSEASPWQLDEIIAIKHVLLSVLGMRRFKATPQSGILFKLRPGWCSSHHVLGDTRVCHQSMKVREQSFTLIDTVVVMSFEGLKREGSEVLSSPLSLSMHRKYNARSFLVWAAFAVAGNPPASHALKIIIMHKHSKSQITKWEDVSEIRKKT